MKASLRTILRSASAWATERIVSPFLTATISVTRSEGAEFMNMNPPAITRTIPTAMRPDVNFFIGARLPWVLYRQVPDGGRFVKEKCGVTGSTFGNPK